MSSEKTLVMPYHQCDDRARQITGHTSSAVRFVPSHASFYHLPAHWRAIQLLLQLHLCMLTIRLFARPDRLARPILDVERTFEHVDHGGDRGCQRRDALAREGEVGDD